MIFKKSIFYEGVKEAIYLNKNLNFKISKEKYIYLRLDPWEAQYYNEDIYDLDSLLISLSVNKNIRILPRNQAQIDYYSKSKFKNIDILRSPLTHSEIISTCEIFIGAGGSMTREFAILGIPTISIYKGKLLSVDKYLIESGFLTHNSNLSINFIEEFLNSRHKKDNDDIFKTGVKSFNLINKIVQKTL